MEILRSKVVGVALYFGTSNYICKAFLPVSFIALYILSIGLQCYEVFLRVSLPVRLHEKV